MSEFEFSVHTGSVTSRFPLGRHGRTVLPKRLIGSIRRECVDHIVVFGKRHLRRILRSYALYYNEMRPHRSLQKDAPESRPIQPIGRIVSHVVVGRLHTNTFESELSVHTPTARS